MGVVIRNKTRKRRIKMSWITEEGLMEYAMDEASDISGCLWKFRQKHNSCVDCRSRDFCNKLIEKLKEWEEEEIQSSEG